MTENNSLQCSVCGYRNDLRANFCSSCGAAIPKPTDTTVVFSPDSFFEDQFEAGDALAAILNTKAPSAVLVIQKGPDVGLTYVLDKDKTTVGRSTDSDIFLDDITVSRNHAVILRSKVENKYSYTIKDVGSLNGTYVNRNRIEEIELVGGDEVQVGKFKLVYVAPQPN